MIVRALGAFAIGALAVYFFDPVSGKRRRDLLRNRLDAKELRGMIERRLGRHRDPPSQIDIDLSQPPQP